MSGLYPPEKHVLRDLRIRIAHGDDDCRAWCPAPPAVRDASGGTRVGVAATLVDVVSAGLALRAAEPDWVATADLHFHSLRKASGPALLVHGRVLRSGRASVVLESKLYDELAAPKGERGSAIAEAADAEAPCALASMSFSILPKRPDNTEKAMVEERGVVDMAGPDSGFERDYLACIGLESLDPAAGVHQLAYGEYVRNRLDAVQGGVVTTLLEVAAESVARARCAGAVTTADLTVQFLALGKVGPFRTRARVLRQWQDSALVRSEIVDTGADDRLMAIGTATVCALEA